jgi:hydrogenase nickel incorporation protein HypB
MTRVLLEKKVLKENDHLAATLRASFERHRTVCVNLVSSPGSGKTMLLEKTLERFDPAFRVAVLTGDIQTDNDARRLARYGFPVRQISTGGACHLDARMVEGGLEGWDLANIDLLFVENVGNLVCPAGYDLGEAARVVILSVTEGEDKPLKYPATFYRADLVVLSKIDLLPYVPFDVTLARENARRINPNIELLELSATTGAGMDGWRGWIDGLRPPAGA